MKANRFFSDDVDHLNDIIGKLCVVVSVDVAAAVVVAATFFQVRISKFCIAATADTQPTKVGKESFPDSTIKRHQLLIGQQQLTTQQPTLTVQPDTFCIFLHRSNFEITEKLK